MSQISEYFRSIFFPNLGITLRNIGDHINIGSFEVRFYGIIIMIGFLLAYVLVTNEAKRTKQNPEMYLDFILILIIPAILGARLYYIHIRSLDAIRGITREEIRILAQKYFCKENLIEVIAGKKV